MRGGLCSEEEEEEDNEEDKSSVVTLLLSFSRVKMVRHERAHELLEYTEDLWHERKQPFAAARSGQRPIRDHHLLHSIAVKTCARSRHVACMCEIPLADQLRA